MRRRLAIALLALGTVGGYTLGFASMRCHGQQRRDAFEQHVAKVCVDAARGERSDRDRDRDDRGPGDRGRATDQDEPR